MKHFDLDWVPVFAMLPRWEALPLPARRGILAYPALATPVPGSQYGNHLAPLLDGGFLEFLGDGTRVKRTAAFAATRGLLWALHEAPWPDVADEEALARYGDVHFNQQERVGLGLGSAQGWGYSARTAAAAVSVSWLEGFLAADPQRGVLWENRALDRASYLMPIGTPPVMAGAQAMIRRLLTEPRPLPLSQLLATCPEVAAELWPKVLPFALRYLLCFAGLDEETLIPLVGLWPKVTARLQRAQPTPPVPVPVEQVYHAAYLLDDMTAVLTIAAATPLRLRADGNTLFARTADMLAAQLTGFPEWLQAHLPDHARRIEQAVSQLEMMGLLRVPGGPTVERGLALTEAGRAWLAASSKERLGSLLTRLRPFALGEPHVASPQWVLRPPLYNEYQPLALLPHYAALYQSLPVQDFVRYSDFSNWHAFAANPLVREAARSDRWRNDLRHVLYEIHEEALELAWMHTIGHLLLGMLAPVGGLRLGWHPEHGLCMALDPIGQYVLGQAPDFTYGETGGAGAGKLVVQPNFEIVFLVPWPAMAAEIGRFAERRGKGAHPVFHLTRERILAAAETGLTAAQVVKTLAGASSKELPANVVRELQGWFAQVRRVVVSPTTLLRCPDVETATRVRGLAGAAVAPLTDTVLELLYPSEQKKLLTKLRQAGIFIQAGS